MLNVLKTVFKPWSAWNALARAWALKPDAHGALTALAVVMALADVTRYVAACLMTVALLVVACFMAAGYVVLSLLNIITAAMFGWHVYGSDVVNPIPRRGEF